MYFPRTLKNFNFSFIFSVHLQEVGEDESGSSSSSPTSSEILVAPMSVQPTRKNKNPSSAVLRRI